MSGAAPVSELKARVSEETGLSARCMYMLYQTKPLRDQATLAVYGLGGEAKGAAQPPTVTLCVRQKGGCFIVSFTILTILFFATVCAPLTCGTSLLLWVFLAPPLLILPFFCL